MRSDSISVSELNSRLHAAYSAAIDALPATMKTAGPASKPHLMRVPDGYAHVDVRLLVVGQETFGWGEDRTWDAADLMQGYADFNLGGTWRRTPFWQAAHQVHHRLNPSGPADAFLWSNLVKLDGGRGRPSQEVENIVSALNLLQTEIEIARPDVVIFFTGPRYEGRLTSTFPGATFTSEGRGYDRVAHTSLPKRSIRTYHPNHLRLSRQWPVLEQLAELCSAAE